jgi:tetratricopeptide (TPR) repeat protein
LRARWQMAHGQDPSAALAQALASLSRAAELVPDAGSINDLANVYLSRGDLLAQQGGDPRPDFAQAVAGYRRALAIVPDFAIAHGNLGIILVKQGRADMDRGVSPASTLDEGIKSLGRTVELMPGVDSVHGYLADAHLARAELARLEDRDPSADLVSARRENALALAKSPDAEGLVLEGEVALLEGRHALANHRPVASSVAEARRSFRRAAEMDPTSGAPWRALARAELLEARAQVDGKGDPFAAVSAALAAVAIAERREAGNAEAHAIIAEAHRIESEFRIAHGQDARDSLRLGLKAADAALARNAGLPPALREKAALLRLMARTAPQGPGRARLEAEADAARRDAVTHDAFLERDLPL